MPKLFSRLLLSVFLLLAQHGALLHELHHAADARTQTGGDHEHHATSDACSACHAFSQVVAGAAADGGAVRWVSVVALTVPAWRGTLIIAPDEPPVRSRGPPTLT
jgi:hypothetical protein